MVTLLLGPAVHPELQVFFKDTLNIAQVIFLVAAFAGYPDRVEPEFRLIPIFCDVHMRWFIGQIRFLEKELVTTHAKDNRHRASN